MSKTLQCLATALFVSVVFAGPRPAAADVILTQVGAPVWQPADFVTFSAPGILSGDEFVELSTNIFPGPEHVLYTDPFLFIGPGAPHAGPYDTEASEGVAALGFEAKSVFSVEDFLGAPAGGTVVTAFQLIPGPNAPNGPSPDFDDGPIIPGDVFPLTLTTAVFRNGVLFEDQGTLELPSLDSIGLATDLDGNTRDFTGLDWSHIQLLGWTDLRFGPPGTDPIGDYVILGSLRDAGGNGWDYSVSFSVIPEPSSFALTSIGIAGSIILVKRRKRPRSG